MANRTFVSPTLRGRGVAALLVDALLAWARQEGHKIDPQCSYVHKVMTSDAAHHDLLST